MTYIVFFFVSENIGLQASICFLYLVYTESGCLKYIVITFFTYMQ